MSEALISASPIIRLNARDNVAVARNLLQPGDPLGDAPSPIEKIGRGHKIALVAIATGAPVVKYGQTIGFASQDIPAGAFVHTHNLTVGDLVLHRH